MSATDERTGLLNGNTLKKRFATKKVYTPLLLVLLSLFICIQFYFEDFGFFLGQSQKKNVIFFVTDGMGPASLSLTRSYRQFTLNLPIDDTLALDKHLIGSSRTRSNDSLVTDSAAGATAFSCSLKSYNGAIGVNPFKQPCGTLLESAKLNGFMTGLVVTTRITDATPASFSAHVDYRIQEDQIALHQLGHYSLGPMVDILIGGGRTHFYYGHTKFGSNGVRADKRNLIQESIDNGWQYVGNRKQFDNLQLGSNVTFPLLCLLADHDIPFDIDRDETEYPSLEEQALTAINSLAEATKDSDKGFFLMIEGSRIDHAGHQNDPAAQVREVLAFDKAFKAALEFAQNSETETVLISTSDHETGGLVTSRQVTKEYPDYVWYPKVLADSKHSGEYLKDMLINGLNKMKSKGEKEAYIKAEILEKYLSIFDYDDSDIDEFLEMDNANDIQDKLNSMISVRALIGWTTHGHSAVDVNIYAYANRKDTWYDILDHLQGNHENTEIGAYMAKYMNLDLEQVSILINNTDHSPPKKSDVEAQNIFIDNYHKSIYQN